MWLCIKKKFNSTATSGSEIPGSATDDLVHELVFGKVTATYRYMIKIIIDVEIHWA